MDRLHQRRSLGGAVGNKQTSASCAKKCIGEGYSPRFVVGEKVYAIAILEDAENPIGLSQINAGSIKEWRYSTSIEKISK